MVNVLVPAAVVPSLRIPNLALNTGTPNVVWCRRSWSYRWSRQHVLALPYDPVAAAKLRKRAKLDAVYAVLLLAYCLLAILAVVDASPSISGWVAIVGVAMAVVSAIDARWDPAPKPVRTGRGDLYIPDLPPPVAQQWIEANPGVRAVDRRPTYRRFAAGVYVAAAMVCMLPAITMVRILFDGADHSLALLFAPPALVVAALSLAYHALPTGHARLRGDI